MFKISKSCVGLTAFLSVCALSSSALAGNPMHTGQAYSVEINKTEIVRLPVSASAVVIGNPAIADVSVHAADTLFVVGRGYGETNLIVLDANGNTVMDTDIQVLQKPSAHSVRVFNRGLRQSYNCAPHCQPSPIIGDDPEFLGNYSATEAPIRSTEALASSNPVRSDQALFGAQDQPIPSPQPAQNFQTPN